MNESSSLGPIFRERVAYISSLELSAAPLRSYLIYDLTSSGFYLPGSKALPHHQRRAVAGPSRLIIVLFLFVD